MTFPIVPVSKKFSLVQIQFGRLVTPTLYSSSPNIYIFDSPFRSPIRVDVVTVELTRAGSISLSDREWYYDEDNLKVYFRDDSFSWPLPASNELVLATYGVYVTNDVDRVYAIDPVNPAATYSTYENWGGRLLNSPSVSFDASDIFAGDLKVSNFEIQISNSDNFFQAYATNETSFRGKLIKFWNVVNSSGTETIELVGEGRCNSISIDNRNVSLSVDNILNKLDDTFYGVTNTVDVYDANVFTIAPQFKDLPIPSLYCKATPSFAKAFARGDSGDSIANAIGEALDAVNISYNDSWATNTNRTWGAFKLTSPTGQHSESIGTVTSLGGDEYRIVVADATLYRYYDNVTINSNLARVKKATASTTIEVTAPLATPVAGQTIIRPEISDVRILDNEAAGGGWDESVPWAVNLDFGTDYTLGSSNGVRTIILANNFEGNFLTGLVMSANARVLYRAWGRQELVDHAFVAQEILEGAGLTVNSASITASRAINTEKVNFIVPEMGSTTFPTIRKIMADICSSTLSILGVNGSDITYNTLKAPTSGTVITDNDMLKGTFKQKIIYTDVAGITHFTNIFREILNSDVDAISNNGVERIDDGYLGAFYVGESRESGRNTVLELPSDRNLYINDLLANRRNIYEFDTSGINFNSKIGDFLTLQRDDLLGGVSSVNVVILAITKYIDKTNVKCSDLYTYLYDQ